MFRNIIVILGIVFMVIIACERIEPADPVPEIGFKDLTVTDSYDTIGDEPVEIKACELIFSFIDGDGDIGLIEDPYDSIDPKNVFIIPFEKLEGSYYRNDELDTLSFWIKHDDKMERVGQNKTLKGEIKVKFSYFKNLISDYDTLKFDFYITDRAENKSNVESTTDVAFD
ncbi:MAG: hypothetical protein JSV22_00920 [Bacteroidales bacterium]|nr:MAG: hypothetical protein JSV22_00920 [Bacteroidales bacterium]